MKKAEGSQSKKLGLWMSTSLVSGNMVGSGVFLLPSALALFGGISLFGWLFSATGAILLALVFSRLSRLIPGAGGPYIYARKGFGDLSGFLVAWGYWISIWSGNAAISVAGVGYLGVFIPALSGNPALSGMTAIGFIWFFSWINTIGVRQAGMVQLFTTIIKLTPLVLIGTLGFLYFKTAHFQPMNLSNEPNFFAISATAALTLWAFLGLESATIPSDQVKDPSRTIPKATIFGTILVSFIYILSTAAVMGIIPAGQLSGSAAPFADAAGEIWGKWVRYFVAGGALVACLGALNGWILLQGQLPLAASNDGVFPAVFRKLTKRQMPGPGILISSLLASILIVMNYSRGLVSMFTFIIMLATLSTLIPYVFSSLANLLFIFKVEGAKNMRKIVVHSVISTLALFFSLWAIWGLGIVIIGWGFVSLVAGLPVYYLVKRQRAKGGSVNNK